MSYIRGVIDELNTIKQEIRKNNATNKTLRLRAKRLENEIKTYLQETQQSGVTYRKEGQAILLENVQKHATKKKSQKESDLIEYLQGLGVPNPGDVYSQIVNLQRGDLVEDTRIAFKNLKLQKSKEG